MTTNKTLNSTHNSPFLRVVLYARVGTQEQTKGNFPSCDAQLEDLIAHSKRENWEIVAAIKDEGYSAGSLQRPGFTKIRQMAQDGAIDVVLSSTYDRLTRSVSDFYELKEEFARHNVQFKTLHEPQDNSIASARFINLLLSAARNFEREQGRGSDLAPTNLPTAGEKRK